MIALDAIRQRLLRLADNCEERARLPSCAPYSRSLFHRTAADARLCAKTLAGEELALALQAALATARFAACINGEEYAEPARGLLERVGARYGQPVAATDAARPLQALKARQLAEMAGMSERGALKRIVNGHDRGLPGFYRDGRRWFAEPDAFAQFRMSSDCPARAIVAL